MTVMASNGRGGGVGRGLGTDEPMARLRVLEHILGCAHIAAVQTSKTLFATHRIAMAFVLISAPGCSERFRKSPGKIERKTKEDLFERRPIARNAALI
jgi:hypothetical protein